MAGETFRSSREIVLSVLWDHTPHANRKVVEATELSQSSVYNALALCAGSVYA